MNAVGDVVIHRLRVQAAAVKGEVYRVRAPIRLSEGLEERDSGEQQQQQFVSTTISAVSCLLLFHTLSCHPLSFLSVCLGPLSVVRCH